MNDAIKRLPGDLRRVAELIGLDATLTLVRHFGGGYLVIPKCEALLRDIRNSEIRKAYDTDKFTIRQLAWRYKLTDRTVQSILNDAPAEVHPALFNLRSR